MMIKHPSDIRRTLTDTVNDRNCYALALHLSRLHPQGLEPTLDIRLSARGIQLTHLDWQDVGIRVFHNSHFKAAVATSYSRITRGLVSERVVIYKMGEPIPQFDIDMLFDPLKQEDRF